MSLTIRTERTIQIDRSPAEAWDGGSRIPFDVAVARGSK